jgi:hypothetical protein
VKHYERLRRKHLREVYARWQQQLYQLLLSEQVDWNRFDALHNALSRIEQECSSWLFEEQKEEAP